MPSLPSSVQILYDVSTDITSDVLPAETTFEGLMNAMPGQATITVKDLDQTHDFVTGRELTCLIDGQELWAGYIINVRRKFFFPAVDTVTRAPGEVRERVWVLTAVDFNILFDKRVVRNPSDYYHQLPNFDTEDFDGALIEEALVDNKYIDVPGGFDVTSEVDSIPAYRGYNTLTNGSIGSGASTVTVDDVDFIPEFPFFAVIKNDGVTGGAREVVEVTGRTGLTLDIERAKRGTSAVGHGDNSFFMHLAAGAWVQQGSTWRMLMEDFAQFSGAVWYISPDKTVHHHSLEDEEARWGFSDNPNFASITGAPGYQNATIGPRDIDAAEDGSVIVNDALVWGGSEWSGNGQTVFARRENTSSQTDHNRWQVGETHFGEPGFRTRKGVAARARVIVDGEPGSVGGDPNRGLRFPQWEITLTWRAERVPKISGTPDHLHAGQLVRIFLDTFGVSQILPLRRLAISFDGLDDSGDAWLKFTGTFGLQLTDPFTLWRYLLKLTNRRPNRTIASVVDGSNAAPYGSLFTGSPEPALGDGSNKIFDLPDDRGYIRGTTEVYLEPGIRMRRDIDYVESDPENGLIRFTVAPANTIWVYVVCRVL